VALAFTRKIVGGEELPRKLVGTKNNELYDEVEVVWIFHFDANAHTYS
jgi:hypothetical protein